MPLPLSFLLPATGLGDSRIGYMVRCAYRSIQMIYHRSMAQIRAVPESPRKFAAVPVGSRAGRSRACPPRRSLIARLGSPGLRAGPLPHFRVAAVGLLRLTLGSVMVVHGVGHAFAGGKLAVTALVLGALGPGRWSIDHALGYAGVSRSQRSGSCPHSARSTVSSPHTFRARISRSAARRRWLPPSTGRTAPVTQEDSGPAR